MTNSQTGPESANPTPPAAPQLLRTAPAAPERLKRRHRVILYGFLLFVLAPVAISGWYLYARAADQYASYAAFAVRSEDMKSSLDLLTGLSAFGGASSKDTDVLFEYIQSRGLVKAIDGELDLRALYARPDGRDPVFAFDTSGTIEDLHKHWGRMVKVVYDRGTGLIELRVTAFSPEDAQAIARAILAHGTTLINRLNAVAREDATRYAREELERSVERLRGARRAVTEYRSANQMVDPSAEIGIQTGLISALQNQLSEVMLEYNLLKDSVSPDSPQLKQLGRKTEVLRQSIDEERLKFSATTSVGSENYSTLVGEYESLMVDLEFAEQAYIAALAAFDTAQIEAQRKSRYLAAHIEPTLAERAEYPKRLLLLATVALFALFGWSTGTLVFYSVRDRR
ncbi:hypothetical protein [Sinisalibacter aestuarii]|uniref:Sugar transporter n=1 Tax=Sinisalibacter aestuarii TaxID=2949426 RepID=A0ABQ5LVJ3_9RHOB|nr:hypothetical protein [Sinisalibacter aestuarii]GKY88623.1 hypothetical protein STA1M1_24920 [Sinisalibacter aestuarii]